MDNSNRSLNVYCKERCSCSGTKQLSRLKCNGSNLGPMKLYGRWPIRYRLCILHCLPVEANQFWYDVWYMFLVHVLVMF